MAGLDQILAEMQRQIGELNRRSANMIRAGRVTEVDAARGLVRIDIGDDESPLVTPFIPWPERAGDRKSWNPPTVGEVMTVMSPSGEISERSLATHGGFTDATGAPSSAGDAAVFGFGGVTITVKGDEVHVAAPKVVIMAAEIALGAEGGPAVARVGDRVHVSAGSSTGFWPIVEGSSIVSAAG